MFAIFYTLFYNIDMYGSKIYATTTYGGNVVIIEQLNPYCKMDTVYFEKSSPFTRKTNPYATMESDC